MKKGFNVFLALGFIFLILPALIILALLPYRLDSEIYQIIFLVGFIISISSFTIMGLCKDDPDYDDPFFTV